MAFLLEAPPELPRRPTEDDLPYDDGQPMESDRHVHQMVLLMQALTSHWTDRADAYVGGNMFVYYDWDNGPKSVGPDVFVVTGVRRREHKSWVTWQEGKGPDLVIELLSPSTAHYDRTEKKALYERLGVPELYLFDPDTGEFAGFHLRDGRYQPALPDTRGRVFSPCTGLYLVRWEGTLQWTNTVWLRWETAEGQLLPNGEELALRALRLQRQERARAEQERTRAEQERARAEQERTRAEQERTRAEQERARADALAARLRELGIDPESVGRD